MNLQMLSLKIEFRHNYKTSKKRKKIKINCEIKNLLSTLYYIVPNIFYALNKLYDNLSF